MRTLTLITTASTVLALSACDPGDGEGTDDLEVLEETVEAGKVGAVTDEVIEVTVDQTLGETATAMAENLYDFWQSQADCAEVTRDGQVVTVDFGVTEGCEWNGKTFTGQYAIGVEVPSEGRVEVTHTFTGFTNGLGTVDGERVVAWDRNGEEQPTRSVSTEATFTGPGGRTLDLSEDRTQRRLVPGGAPGTGIVVDGERSWTVEGRNRRATWSTEIQSVEMRPQDPVPQAGAYVTTGPNGTVYTLTFERQSEDVIRVTSEGPRRTTVYDVRLSGEIEEVEGAS